MVDLAGKRAARLLRVSTKGQDEDNQDEPTAGYIVTRGMLPGPTYKLRGKSASKGHQVKAVREAIAAAERGEFDCLVIRAIDRLDRRGSLAGWRLLGELLDAGLTVLSAEPSEAFLEHLADGSMPMVGTLVSAKLDLAYEEVKAKTRRIDDAFRRMDEEGSFRGLAPMGYRSEGPEHHKRLVPDVAGRVKRNGERAHTSAEIAAAITDASTGTSTSKLGKRLGMQAASVNRMLRNPIYGTGRYVITSHRECAEKAACRDYRGERDSGSRCVTVQKRTEPLVDPDVQARAVAGLEARRSGDGVRSRGEFKDDFSGVLWCLACAEVTDKDGNAVQEGRLYRKWSNGGKRVNGKQPERVRRYHCATCGKSLSAPEADAEVDRLMSARTSLWFRLVYVPGDDHAAELERIRLELAELGARGLADDEYDAELARLRAERDRLKELPRVAPTTSTEIADETEGQRWMSLDPQERREWLNNDEFRLFVKSSGNHDRSVIVEFDYVPDDEESWIRDPDGTMWSSEGDVRRPEGKS